MRWQALSRLLWGLSPSRGGEIAIASSGCNSTYRSPVLGLRVTGEAARFLAERGGVLSGLKLPAGDDENEENSFQANSS